MCNEYLVRGTTPLECTYADCNSICHRKTVCSGVNRGAKYPKWKCPEHCTPHTTQATIVQDHLNCDVCSRKIQANSIPLKCAECEKVCHVSKNCSRISPYERPKVWRCRLHSDTTDSQAERQTNRLVVTADTQVNCDHCKKTIRKWLNPLKCPACGKVCHRQEKCSKIHRGVSNPVWKCGDHSGNIEAGEETTQQSTQQSTQPPNNRELCKCKKCKRTINSNHRPIVCSEDVCQATFHKKCAGIPRQTEDRYLDGSIRWTCEGCVKRLDGTNHQHVHSQPCPEATSKGKDETETKKSLRVLQWNANGLGPKMDELRDRMKDMNLDAVMIQETKYGENSKTPTIPGYTPMRADRINKDGGGLISYIKSSLCYQKLKDQSKDGTEVSTFKVKLSRNKWTKLSNVYCPPKDHNNPSQRLATEIIPVSDNLIVAGDFNAHSALWDQKVETDARGEEMEDWILDNNLAVNNNGNPTRSDTRGYESTPDVTLCGNLWANKMTWDTLE